MAQSDVAAEVELVRSIVGKYFPIYDVKVSYDSMTLYVSPDVKTLGPNFENIRKELKEKRFIPLLNYTGGEYILSVVRKPEVKPRGAWVNWVFLAITFVTTGAAGMLLWASYNDSAQLFTFDNILYGALFFAIPLMTILGVHEYCHYLASKRHGVEASLPFFIPSIPPFGTFGAFISIREPMPNRKALVDIGAAGPLGGLAVTIPIAILGLYLTAHGHASSGQIPDGGALAVIIQPLYQLLLFISPMSDGMAMHPLAFAAWVGFLVTAINLLPAGQLDGGHIARGLFGDSARYVSYATGIALFILTLFYYDGWLIFALMVFLLGLRHPAPLNDISKPDTRTKVVGAAAILILFATFVPTPMVTILPDHSFTVDVLGGNNTTVAAGGFYTFQLMINNTGTGDIKLNMISEGTPGDWGDALYPSDQNYTSQSNSLSIDIGYGNSTTVLFRVQVSNTASTAHDITIQSVNQDLVKISKVVTISVS